MAGDGWIRRRPRPLAPPPPPRKKKQKRKARKNVGIRVESEVVNRDEIESWISPDESASHALDSLPIHPLRRSAAGSAAAAEDDDLLPAMLANPPLNRVPVHPGHVLEISGPSGSGKTELLVQAAVLALLPTRFGGIVYGGSQGIVVMFDLDGRFEISRLTTVMEAHIRDMQSKSCSSKEPQLLEDQKNAVLSSSLKRFYRIRCSSNFEFLCALKTFSRQKQRMEEEHPGKEIQLLLIDGIGVFYWLDWVSSCAISVTGKKTLGVQTFSELIVRELRSLRSPKSFPIVATKSLLYGPARKGPWNVSGQIEHREYMPAPWKNFVTHRMLLQESALEPRVFIAQWEKPFVTEQQMFRVEEHGILSQVSDDKGKHHILNNPEN